MITLLRRVFLHLIFTTFLFTTTASAISYSQIGNMYFFGDSLSDSGFNDLWPTVANPPTVPMLPPGKAPTFTTFGGYTWSQYIARDIKGIALPIYPGPSPADLITNNSCCNVPGFSSATLTGFNYASAGSTTDSIGVSETWAPSLRTQVQTFISTHTIQPNDVFFIWEGANDLLAVIESAPPSDFELEYQLLKAANNAAVNIASEVARLSARGAKRFVIISLPNIGRAPLVNIIGDPFFTQSAKNISFTFDSMLNQELGRVIARYSIKVLYIDVYTLLDAVINTANAGKPYYVQGQPFIFTNTTEPACGFTTPAVYCTTGSDGHVFADLLHPTDEAHRLISLYVEGRIQSWS